MKLLTIDIETAPNGGWIWDLWNQNISLAQLRENVRILCFAAKWYGEDKIMFYSEFQLIAGQYTRVERLSTTDGDRSENGRWHVWASAGARAAFWP